MRNGRNKSDELGKRLGRGWNTYLSRAHDATRFVRAYAMFERILTDFAAPQVLPFDKPRPLSSTHFVHCAFGVSAMACASLPSPSHAT